MKIALVHDDLVQAGGAERVAATLHKLFPDAPLFTSLYDPGATLPYFAGIDVRTSFLQRTPLAHRRWHKLALPWFPLAFEGFDLAGYDLVLSSASRFAKGVLTPPETCHVCYCYTPPRFAWRLNDYLAQNRGVRLLAPWMRRLLCDLRAWDLASAQRVDRFITSSHYVARRIRKYYGRDAAVIPPPVSTDRFQPVSAGQVGDHFLVVSRLLDYKRIDLAIQACNYLGVELRIVGDGPALPALRRLAGPTVRFLGRLSDSAVADEYARCQALIFPGEEDFGLTPIECMASGRPVVAFGAGGALETVVEGTTGIFFHEPSGEALVAALEAVRSQQFVPAALQAHAARFDLPVFQGRILHFLSDALQAHQECYGLPQGDKPGMPWFGVQSRLTNIRKDTL